MGNAWFETVAEAERRARRRLPQSVHMALIAGSERGVTVRCLLGPDGALPAGSDESDLVAVVGRAY